MLDYSQGKIFLAAERGHMETDSFRSFSTFNFGSYQHPIKTPVASLYLLNDDTLAGKQNVSLEIEEPTDILLIPVVGAITYSDDTGNESFIEAGQAQLHAVAAGSTIRITNPYEDELVNFIQFWFKRYSNKDYEPIIHRFNIDQHKNTLVPLFSNHPGTQPKVYIGKFWGRQEIAYKRTFPEGKLFVFVLEGAFEVQYRLLETRDGLALSGVDEIEIEALSNNAIIIMVEMP
jgi:redox-sensitive bicupin YhaK (pirin superfamily)